MEILPQSFHGVLDNTWFVALRPPQISKFDKLRDHLGRGSGPAKLNDDPHAVAQPGARGCESALTNYHATATSDQRLRESMRDWSGVEDAGGATPGSSA